MLCWPQEGKVEGRSMLRQRVGTSIRAVVFLRSLNLTTVLPTLCPRLVMGGGIGICLTSLALMPARLSNCECRPAKGESSRGEVCLTVLGEMSCSAICLASEHRPGPGGRAKTGPLALRAASGGEWGTLVVGGSALVPVRGTCVCTSERSLTLNLGPPTSGLCAVNGLS